MSLKNGFNSEYNTTSLLLSWRRCCWFDRRIYSCLLSEEGGLLAFLARRNSGSIALSPDRDSQSVLCDNVLPYH